MERGNLEDKVIERILARQDLKELVARYALYGSRCEWSNIANLFVDDGVFSAVLPPGQIVKWQGRDEILRNLEASNPQIFPLVQNEIIEINGNDAVSTCTLFTPIG